MGSRLAGGGHGEPGPGLVAPRRGLLGVRPAQAGSLPQKTGTLGAEATKSSPQKSREGARTKRTPTASVRSIVPLPCSLMVSHDLELRAKSLIWPLSLYLGCSPLPLFLSRFGLIPFLLAFLALAPLASFQHWLRIFPSSTGPHTYCSLSLECFSTTHSFRLVSPYSFIS